MRVIYLAVVYAVYSCNSKTDNQAAGAANPDSSIHIADSARKTQSITGIQPDSVTSFFDEEHRRLYLLYLDRKGRADTIELGEYFNTFRQPPHQVHYNTITGDKMAIVVATNIIQLGVSRDAVHVLIFDKKSRSVIKVCTFQDIAVYEEGTALDTLEDIVLYDYKITPLSDSSAQFTLSEYTPYKLGNADQGLKHKYKEKKRTCLIR